MRLTHTQDTHRVVADGYQAYARDGAAGVVVADPDGRAWSRISLLASLDRVDRIDESYDVEPLRITERDGVVQFELRAASTAWRTKSVVLHCFPDRLELTTRVEGSGAVGEVSLFGGRAVLPSGACGVFRSSIEFGSLFNPTPTEPIQVVRPALAAATLGAHGDSGPGRLHGVFCPPPLCLVFGRSIAIGPMDIPEGDWFSLGLVAGAEALRFAELRYTAVDGGFLLSMDYEGRTVVSGAFETPPLVLRPVRDPWRALAVYRDDLVSRGCAPAGPVAPAAEWWREPIFCGWGAQCAEAARQAGVGDVAGPAAALSARDGYDAWLGRLAAHGVVPGTIVIDDRWQTSYGTAEPDVSSWPDLRGWIAARHAMGQRVLLWWKAWDAEGLPPEECILSPSGAPLAADPASPAYVARLHSIVTGLLGPDGLDADGFKVDFTQRLPTGCGLHRPGAPADAPWGIALLHALLGTLYHAAKRAKPDALVITHTPHPAFGDVTDMLRLNDLLAHDLRGDVVPAVRQLAFRHGVVSRSMPGHPIDTDQWPIATRPAWRDYVRQQAKLGVPSLYYAERLHFTEYLHFAERIDRAGDELTADDLALVAATWTEYRASRSRAADRELDALLAEQIAYYRARAGEYDATYPLDDPAAAGARRQLAAALETLAPYGRVLELACGTGQWTVELAHNASAVTAVDSSPEALAICRRRVEAPHVSFVQADLFAWRPQHHYDLVFFAGWLSHVPPQRFDAFWTLVADCLAPDGRAFVIDELPAVAAGERPAPGQPAPAVWRRLATGHSYRAVKVCYEPDDLRRRLAALGWDAEVRTVGWRFFCATVHRLDAADRGSGRGT